MTGQTADRPSPPVLRVINGDATPEEVAAILAIVGARSGGGEAEPTSATSAWTRAHSHRVTQVLSGGAPAAPSDHTWRTSFWPK